MQPDPREVRKPAPKTSSRLAAKPTLELCFVAIMGILVLSGFVAALTYNYVSAIGPVCIMIPLLILVGVQFKRTLKASHGDVVKSDLSRVIKGRNEVFNAIVMFIGWMAVLLAMIFLAGHYIGIAVFMFVLLRFISEERMVLSAAISVSVTLVIYMLFEYGFNIEMYRGLAFRWFSS